MIKKIFLLLCLSGCAVDLAYIEVFREGLKKNEINDLQPFLDTNLSFVKATKGKNQAIFILSDYNEGVETWVGADNERITTYKGVIIRTSKLDHDMTVQNIEALQKNIFQDNIQLLASLSNPSVSYLNLELTLDKIITDDLDCNGKKYNYDMSVSTIDFNSELLICISDAGEILSTYQRLNPFDEYIYLEYYYQYK